VIDVFKALNFVKNSDDGILIALANYAVDKISKKEAVEKISVYQLADGGWTGTDKDFQAKISVISTTWYALQWMIWLEAADTKEFNNTISFLKSHQSKEGYWDEPVSILDYNPPFWMEPGKYENQLWLSSAVCCKLKELNMQASVNYDQAISFLVQGWDGERFPVFTHTHWMGLYLFFDMQKYKYIADGCKDFLIDAINNEQVDPADYCAITYNSFNTGEYSRDLFELSYNKFLNYQADDGGIITNYGDKHRAGLTVEALFLLKKMGEI